MKLKSYTELSSKLAIICRYFNFGSIFETIIWNCKSFSSNLVLILSLNKSWKIILFRFGLNFRRYLEGSLELTKSSEIISLRFGLIFEPIGLIFEPIFIRIAKLIAVDLAFCIWNITLFHSIKFKFYHLNERG